VLASNRSQRSEKLVGGFESHTQCTLRINDHAITEFLQLLIIYIPGNHDEMIGSFLGHYGNISIEKHAIHRTANGGRILVIHGHELDTVVQNVKWLAFAGDLAYEFLLSLNPLVNFIRRRFGLGYWSLSAYAKQRVKNAVSFIGKFEEAIAKYAERFRVDAVLCGHIHSASIRRFGKVGYYNCGDWVETCSALVEHHDGRIEIIYRRERQAISRSPSIMPAMA
jgi:UDP-2,3-diacylglucosamine pyrophosphatase LpxH